MLVCQWYCPSAPQLDAFQYQGCGSVSEAPSNLLCWVNPPSYPIECRAACAHKGTRLKEVYGATKAALISGRNRSPKRNYEEDKKEINAGSE